ncbi:MAG: hypothetical protein ACI9EW_001754 [Cellvibrionaceae bacterium]
MPKQNPTSPQSVFGKISAVLDTFTVVGPEERVLPIQRMIIGELQHAADKFRKMNVDLAAFNS